MILRSIIILCSILSQLPATAEYWKHSEQQGEVGSCHSFATIALIEAEYWKSTGKHINLSERDLFIRHYTQGYANANDCIQQQLIKASSEKLPDHYKEDGHVADDFALLQKHGVASERELRYSPLFSQGVDIGIRLLRHQRNELSIEADLLKKSNQWSPALQAKKIRQRSSKLKAVAKTLTLPAHTKTRSQTKAFINQYSLKKTTPATTALAKQQLIHLLATRPVIVDITNLNELSGNPSTRHSRHSLVVSQYHADSDQFSVRSATFKGSKAVDASALARGTYQLYFLEKSSR